MKNSERLFKLFIHSQSAAYEADTAWTLGPL